ncbi:MAG TPA: hypothetical protein VJA17_05695 [Candidatus Omnitrophota bacterium]|nr:hypothetical protein [Candidatus Omnitrophota bacterium]
MFNNKILQDLLSRIEFSQKDKLLFILLLDEEKPKPISQIKDIAYDFGLREAKSWNISAILRSAKGLAILLKRGWMITLDGRKYLLDKKGLPNTKDIVVADSLRKQLSKIKNGDTVNFLNEAISCLEHGSKRAAVILSWVGAMSVLHDYIVGNHFSSFNIEAQKRFSDWKPAKTKDDLSRMKETNFLIVLEVISVLGKNVKQELEACLQLRNSCGHPNSLQIGESKVLGHIEILILNVFSKF